MPSTTSHTAKRSSRRKRGSAESIYLPCPLDVEQMCREILSKLRHSPHHHRFRAAVRGWANVEGRRVRNPDPQPAQTEPTIAQQIAYRRMVNNLINMGLKAVPRITTRRKS